MKYYTLRPPALRPVPASKHAQDAACSDGGWHPLTKEQKRDLSILARKAATAQGITGTKAIDAWRHEVALKACGHRISEATQRNWADIKSAFEDLAGRPEKAFQTQMRDGDNKRRVALYKLTQALSAKGIATTYAAAICRVQFKCPLEEASAKQLWCLFYTVTNRKSRNGKAES